MSNQKDSTKEIAAIIVDLQSDVEKLKKEVEELKSPSGIAESISKKIRTRQLSGL